MQLRAFGWANVPSEPQDGPFLPSAQLWLPQFPLRDAIPDVLGEMLSSRPEARWEMESFLTRQ